MDRSQLLRGVLDAAVLAVVHQQDGYGYPLPDQSGGYAVPDPSGGYVQQDAYVQQGGYGYPQDPYAWQQQAAAQGYDPNTGYLTEQAHGDPHQQYYQQHQDASLDETSLFDTSMIDLDRLRQYEQGH